MAGRGSQTFKKRQKERQRKEKQEEKLARRLERKRQGSHPPGIALLPEPTAGATAEGGEPR